MTKKLDFILVGFFAMIVAVVPLVLRNDYYVGILVFIGINTILVLGLNLLMGYAGQISLGHAAFFGLGAYASSILTKTYGFPPVAALFLASLFVGFVALILGMPSLRLRGQYLAMATLGFGIIMFILFKKLVFLTEGSDGMRNVPPFSIFGVIFSGKHKDIAYYYLTWVFAILLLVLSLNLVNSRIGRALKSLHSSEIAASSLGIDIKRYKISIFVMSAMYASIAGSIFAHFKNFVAPSDFDFKFSIQLVTMVVVGGMASIWGSIFGACILTPLPEFLTIFEDFDIIIYGLILMVIMIFMPEGLTRGVVDRIKRIISR